MFNELSSFPGLKPNSSNCEIIRIGALKWVRLEICDMKSINLNNEYIKILKF